MAAKPILAALFMATAAAGAPTLATRPFEVCGQKLRLEVADTPESKSQGLMHREGLAPGHGMLFVSEQSEPQVFWMKNVSFDIDIAFFDDQGRLINALTMKGTSPLVLEDKLPRYESSAPARYAVEVAAGFFASVKNSGCRLKPLPSK